MTLPAQDHVKELVKQVRNTAAAVLAQVYTSMPILLSASLHLQDCPDSSSGHFSCCINAQTKGTAAQEHRYILYLKPLLDSGYSCDLHGKCRGCG